MRHHRGIQVAVQDPVEDGREPRGRQVQTKNCIEHSSGKPLPFLYTKVTKQSIVKLSKQVGVTRLMPKRSLQGLCNSAMRLSGVGKAPDFACCYSTPSREKVILYRNPPGSRRPSCKIQLSKAVCTSSWPIVRKFALRISSWRLQLQRSAIALMVLGPGNTQSLQYGWEALL